MSYRGLYIYNFSLQYLLSGNVFTDMYLHTIPVVYFLAIQLQIFVKIAPPLYG